MLRCAHLRLKTRYQGGHTDKLVVEPLFYIFFVYGLSFLFMFYLIMKGAMKTTSAPLIYSFYMLAAFGLTHGLTEMIDWIRFILRTVGLEEIKTLTYLSQTFLIISFVFLLQFGINLLTYESKQKKVIRAIPVVLFISSIVVILALGITDVLKIGLLGRYGFGFTGSILGAISLFKLADTMKPLENRKLVGGLHISGAAFICYALFGGLIITPIAGIPIQLFRSACAVTIALSSFGVLEIFKYVKPK